MVFDCQRSQPPSGYRRCCLVLLCKRRFKYSFRYRDFPVIVPGEISVKNKRTYTCNFLGSLYPNSSRVTLLKTLQASKQQSYCLIHARQE